MNIKTDNQNRYQNDKFYLAARLNDFNITGAISMVQRANVHTQPK